MGLESFINGAGIASKALDYVDTAVQYYNQKKLNRQAEKDTQQNMKLAHDLNLQSVADSYVQSIAGMRRAGINPSQAVGNTNNAVGVSALGGNAGAAAKPENSLPAALEAGTALAQQESQIENIRANTELQKAETSLKRQQVNESEQSITESQSRVELNAGQMKMLRSMASKFDTEQLLLGNEFQRKISEDSVVHSALMELCDRKISAAKSENERDWWSALRAIGRKSNFDAGSLMAMRLFSEFYNQFDDTDLQILARQQKRQIIDAQIKDNKLMDVIAHAPEYQTALLIGQTAEAWANARFREAYRTDLLPIEQQKLDEDIRVMKHNDPAGMARDGDFLGLGIYGLGFGLRLGADVVRDVILYKGLSSRGAGSELPKPSIGSPKSSAPQPGKTSDGKTPPKIDTRSDSAVKQSVAVRLGMSRSEALYDEFLKSGYRSRTGANAFSEWLARVKHIGH